MVLISEPTLGWTSISLIGLHTLPVMNDKVYFIVYSAHEDQYSTYLPISQKMINSFKIGKPSVEGKNSSVELTSK